MLLLEEMGVDEEIVGAGHEGLGLRQRDRAVHAEDEVHAVVDDLRDENPTGGTDVQHQLVARVNDFDAWPTCHRPPPLGA